MGMGIIYKILGALRHSIQILKLKLMKAQKRKNDKGKVKILFIRRLELCILLFFQ